MSLPLLRGDRPVVVVATPACRRRLARVSEGGASPAGAPVRPMSALADVRPPRAAAPFAVDASRRDWPLERWTGPVYALSNGRPVRGPSWWREGAIGVALVGIVGVLALGNGLAVLAAVVALAVTALLALPWPRHWLEAWLTPATAARPAGAGPASPTARRRG